MTYPAAQFETPAEPPAEPPRGAPGDGAGAAGVPPTVAEERADVLFVETLPTADIVAEARARGLADAQSGAVDAWTFDENSTLPYLQRLRRRFPHELETRTEQYRVRVNQARDAERQRATQEERDNALRQADRDRAEGANREAIELLRRAVARLDRMAVFEAWRRETRHIVDFTAATRVQPPADGTADALDRDAERIGAEADGADGMEAYDADADGAEIDGGVPGLRTYDDDPDEQDDLDGPADNAITGTLRTRDLEGLMKAGWEGYSPPILRPMAVRIALFTLFLVDVPIQYIVFSRFHLRNAEGFGFTLLITLPVAAAMIFFPHFAGRLIRARRSTGREIIRTVVATVLLIPWVGIMVFLGIARTNVLSATTETARGDTQAGTDPSAALGLSPTTISIMFIAILALTGGLALLLGLAHQHPYLEAFDAARDEHARAQETLGLTEPNMPEQPMRTLTPTEARTREDEMRETLRLAFIDAEYAYLDGCAEGLHDPAATEAIGRFARRLTQERERQGDER